MRIALIIILLTFLAFIGGWYFNDLLEKDAKIVIKNNEVFIQPEKPLEKYQIDNLSVTQIQPGTIEMGEIIEEEETFTSYLFSMKFDPTLEGLETKTTTGMVNIPNDDGKYPAVVMFRGYVNQSIYTTGMGTKNAGNYFADNGFITIAPDFLGYADSDIEAENIFESRFQTYVTALTLLNSLDQIEKWGGENVFIWGHSNGGQVAITALEVNKLEIPTTLWAPVTKPFPYSILYYTDESTDKGKFIRSELAKFEELYDVEKYSLDNYVTNINAKLLIHQGTYDDAVPYGWTDSFVKVLEDNEIDVTYHKYPGADHNLKPSWDTVVEKDIEYFRNNIK